ncbi:MAG: IS630 family transposase [Thermodesulfovibrionales bacterium]
MFNKLMSYTLGRRQIMRPHGSPKELEQRRQRAISLLREGYQPVDVATMLGVDRRSVRRWKATHRQKGEKGIRAKQASGRPPKLDNSYLRKLEKALLKGSRKAGYPTDLWTCPRVAQLIHSLFGVRYHVDHIGRILHDLGWSPQKPERRAIERDETRIKEWVKVDWPRIKKKLPN